MATRLQSDLVIADLEAERALLGSMLIDPVIIAQVTDGTVEASDFHGILHGAIFDALVALGEQVDTLTVGAWLKDHNVKGWDENTGWSLLAELTQAVVTAMNWRAYAERVRTMAVRRRMVAAAGQIAKLAYQLERPVDDAYADAQRALEAVGGGSSAPKSITLRSGAERFIGALGEPPRIIPTGLNALDMLMDGGYTRGTLTVLSGAPGSGKSAMALMSAYFALLAGKTVIYASFEVDWFQVFSRLTSLHLARKGLRIPFGEAVKGQLSEDMRQRFEDGYIELAAAVGDRLIVNDHDTMTPEQFRAFCVSESMKLGRPADLIVLDQMQHMRVRGIGDTDSYAMVSAISGELRRLPKQLRAAFGSDAEMPAVLALSKMSRSGYTGGKTKPGMGDLRDSGNIESDAADIILMWSEPDVPTVVNMRLEKARLGQTATFQATYERAYNWIK